MKVTFKTLQAMRRDIRTIAEYYNFNDTIAAFKKDESATAFSLWHHVVMNRAYTSDNPNVKFIGNGRLLRYDENFHLYPEGTNDNTLKTALLKVCRELFAV